MAKREGVCRLVEGGAGGNGDRRAPLYDGPVLRHGVGEATRQDNHSGEHRSRGEGFHGTGAGAGAGSVDAFFTNTFCRATKASLAAS